MINNVFTTIIKQLSTLASAPLGGGLQSRALAAAWWNHWYRYARTIVSGGRDVAVAAIHDFAPVLTNLLSTLALPFCLLARLNRIPLNVYVFACLSVAYYLDFDFNRLLNLLVFVIFVRLLAYLVSLVVYLFVQMLFCIRALVVSLRFLAKIVRFVVLSFAKMLVWIFALVCSFDSFALCKRMRIRMRVGCTSISTFCGRAAGNVSRCFKRTVSNVSGRCNDVVDAFRNGRHGWYDPKDSTFSLRSKLFLAVWFGGYTAYANLVDLSCDGTALGGLGQLHEAVSLMRRCFVQNKEKQSLHIEKIVNLIILCKKDANSTADDFEVMANHQRRRFMQAHRNLSVDEKFMNAAALIKLYLHFRIHQSQAWDMPSTFHGYLWRLVCPSFLR